MAPSAGLAKREMVYPLAEPERPEATPTAVAESSKPSHWSALSLTCRDRGPSMASDSSPGSPTVVSPTPRSSSALLACLGSAGAPSQVASVMET